MIIEIKSDNSFPVTTDALLLADFTAAYAENRRVERMLDLGCGSGIISLKTAARLDYIAILGVEISPEAAQDARKNVELNGLQTRIAIVTADLRNFRELYKAGEFDIITANPPYFPTGSGRVSNNNSRKTARSEVSADFYDFCAAAAYGARNGGAFLSVMRAARLAEVFRCLAETGFEPKRLQFVQKNTVSPPRLVLVDARRNGKPPLEILPPLYLY